jgi:ubiquinone/menaquinone biosynthesis C-methylase UbiE
MMLRISASRHLNVKQYKHEKILMDEAVTGVLEQMLHHQVTYAQQGLLPPGIQLATYHKVLHLNCQTGAWAIDFARTYPHVSVTGLDSSPSLIKVARQHKQAGNIKRVQFFGYHPEHPLPVNTEYFDLVHFSLFLPMFRPLEWPVALQDYWRVLRPGGTLSLACLSLGTTSSNGFQRLLQLAEDFYRLQGYAFAEGASSLFHGIYLGPLLRSSGFTQINYTLSPVNLGGNNHEGRSCCRLLVKMLQGYKQRFVVNQLIEAEEFDATAASVSQDLQEMFYASGTLFALVACKEVLEKAGRNNTACLRSASASGKEVLEKAGHNDTTHLRSASASGKEESGERA